MLYSPTSENICRASDLLVSGNVVVMPTETVYGLAANAQNPDAIKKIYKIKGRPSNNPLIIHLANLEQIAQVTRALDLPLVKTRLDKLCKFWPGPLSLVVPKADSISEVASASLDTIAIRIPNHKVALELLQTCKLPLAAPSANRSGYISPTNAQAVAAELGEEIPMIIDGGPCQVGLESTVLSIISEKPILLRPGAITAEQISSTLDEELLIHDHDSQDKDQPLPSPGLAYLHYAPNTKLQLIHTVDFNNLPDRVGFISFKPISQVLPKNIITIRILSLTGDAEEIARNLFNSLRELDQLQLNLIIVDIYTKDGLGRAIMDRLERAVSRI